MARRFQFGLKHLFAVTLLAAIATAGRIHYLRRMEIARATAELHSLNEKRARLEELLPTCGWCGNLQMDIVEMETELKAAIKRLKELDLQ